VIALRIALDRFVWAELVVLGLALLLPILLMFMDLSDTVRPLRRTLAGASWTMTVLAGTIIVLRFALLSA
jgi:hypothetical protein